MIREKKVQEIVEKIFDLETSVHGISSSVGYLVCHNDEKYAELCKKASEYALKIYKVDDKSIFRIKDYNDILHKMKWCYINAKNLFEIRIKDRE